MEHGDKLNAISLFSGIGGFELGLSDYCRTLLYCEADKHAQAVLLSRMAEGAIDVAPISTDVREITAGFVDMPIDIVFGGFPCFVKDTMVFTENGYKPIQNIYVGEHVLTHKRRWRKVTQTHVTENRQIRLVDGTGFLVTETTDEHPYYVRKSKQVWDNSKRRYHREFTDPQFVEARELQGLHVGMTFIPDTIDDEHSEDFWWLIGRCLACGWCVERHDRSTDGYSKVVVSCGRHRAEELEERINRCFHFTKDEDRTANKYHITNKEFADFFSKADIGALNKHIPNEWLMLPKEKLSALLDGYFSGDGSAFVSKSGREGRRCTTVSKKLALTLQMAILKCYGVVPSLFYYEIPETTVIEGRTVNQHPQYQVQYADFNRSSYVDISGEYGWGVCRKSDETDKFETVYNIAVEEDESYIANGAIVHNCQDISCAGKGVGLEGERSGLFFEIVRLAGEIKPTFLFLENVSAIRTRGLDRVILELTEVGYDLRWCMLSAADVGAPHRRERWFLLAARRRDALANPESIGSGRVLRDISGENAEIGQSEEQHEDKAREPEPTGINTPVLADTESSQPWQPTERQWGEDTGRRSEDCRRAEREGETPMANPNSERWESKTGLGDREPLPTTPEGTTISGGQGIPSMADTESIGVQGLWTSGQPQPDPYGQSGLPVCQSENSGDERSTESIMGRVADGVSLDVVKSRKAHLDPSYWKEEPEGIPRVTEEREQRVDRIKRLGNAVVPLQARTAFEYLMGIYKENNPNLIMPMPLIIPKQRPVVEYEEVEW